MSIQSVARNHAGAAWRSTTLRSNAAVIAVGVAGAFVAAAGAGTPSYWGDEAASVMSAQRSLPSLFGLLGRIDAVHGLYYLFLHFWIDLFGASEFSTRLPSALAVGAAAAGVVALTRRFAPISTAVSAGVVFIALPRMSFAGIEARSYSLSAAVAAWLCVLFVDLLDSTTARWWKWLALGAAVGAASYLFLYLVLLAAVFSTVLLCLRRSPLQPIALIGLGTLICATPLMIIAVAQRKQVSYLAERGYANPYSVLVEQWLGSPWLATLGWLLIIAAIATFTLRLTGDALLSRTGVTLGGVWLALPTVLLLVGDAMVSPMYNIRYLTFCAPAAAILIAGGAAALPALVRRVHEALAGTTLGARRSRAPTAMLVIVAGVVLASVPAYLSERGPLAKDGGSDLRQLAQHVERISRPGDAIVFDQTAVPSQHPRLALRLYPEYFGGLHDIGLNQSYTDRVKLWDRISPVNILGPELAPFSRVLAVEMSDQPRGTPMDIRRLRALGFRIQSIDHVHRTDIYIMVRAVHSDVTPESAARSRNRRAESPT